MGKKRNCFASSVVCTDEFLELSYEAQALYFQLGFDADVDGAISGIKGVVRRAGCSDDALRELIEADFLLEVANFIVFPHWWINNTKHGANYREGDHLTIMLTMLELGEDKMYRPYPLRNGDVSDISPLNIKEANIMEGNGSEGNPNELNSNNKIKKGNEEPSSCIPCPMCGSSSAIAPQGTRLYGECPSCDHQFFIDPKTGELIED